MDESVRLFRRALAASLAVHGLAAAMLPSLRQAAAQLSPLLVELPRQGVEQSIPAPVASAAPAVRRPPDARHALAAPLADSSAPPALPVPSPAPASPAAVAPAVEGNAAPSNAVVASAGAAAEPQYVPPRFGVSYLDNPAPAYPAAARRRHVQGTVRLEVLVGTDGRPREIRVAEGSGAAELDEAARTAVSGWRFVAARRGDQAVEGWVLVPVRFRLGDGAG